MFDAKPENVAAVETRRTIRAFCRLSKILYGSSGVGGDTGGAGCGALGVTAGPSPGWSAVVMAFRLS